MKYIVTPFLLSQRLIYQRHSEKYEILSDIDHQIPKFIDLVFGEKPTKKTIVLFVYNKSTKIVIDAYISYRKRKPGLIIISPYRLYTDLKDNEIIYSYARSNNTYVDVTITPKYRSLVLQIKKVLEAVRHMRLEKIVVIASGKIINAILGKEYKKPNNVYFISKLTSRIKDVSLVIDSMISEDSQYVSFSESIERFFAFSGVVYYRLMSRETLRKLPEKSTFNLFNLHMSLIHQGIAKEGLSGIYGGKGLDFFSRKSIESTLNLIRDNGVSEMDDIFRIYGSPLDIKPAIFFSLWIKAGYDVFVGKIISLVLSNKRYSAGLIDMPKMMGDIIFNRVNKRIVIRHILDKFGGDQILIIFNAFIEFIRNSKNSKWCDDNYLDYNILDSLRKDLERWVYKDSKGEKVKQDVHEFNALEEVERAFPIIRQIYKNDSLSLTTRTKTGHYLRENLEKPFVIDSTLTVHLFREKQLPIHIYPLVCDNTRNSFIIYLYIPDKDKNNN